MPSRVYDNCRHYSSSPENHSLTLTSLRCCRGVCLLSQAADRVQRLPSSCAFLLYPAGPSCLSGILNLSSDVSQRQEISPVPCWQLAFVCCVPCPLGAHREHISRCTSVSCGASGSQGNICPEFLAAPLFGSRHVWGHTAHSPFSGSCSSPLEGTEVCSR